MHHLLQIWFDWVLHGGYLGIIVLMALESSIFPVPSEIVIPPAAFLASQGKLNLWGVIAAGTFGSWLGASVTYWVSLWLGRVLIVKWGRFFAISESKLTRAEHWLRRYEAGRDFLRTPAACDSASHFRSSRNHPNEFHHLQPDDDRGIGDVVRRVGLVWSNSDHA